MIKTSSLGRVDVIFREAWEYAVLDQFQTLAGETHDVLMPNHDYKVQDVYRVLTYRWSTKEVCGMLNFILSHIIDCANAQLPEDEQIHKSSPSTYLDFFTPDKIIETRMPGFRGRILLGDEGVDDWSRRVMSLPEQHYIRQLLWETAGLYYKAPNGDSWRKPYSAVVLQIEQTRHKRGWDKLLTPEEAHRYMGGLLRNQQ